MPPTDETVWAQVKTRVDGGEPVAAVARDLGLAESTARRHLARMKTSAKPAAARSKARARPVKKSSTRPRPASAPPPKRARPANVLRRQLINRLYRAIDTKLKLMERRMNNEIDALAEGKAEEGGNLTAADHERETRAFGALVKTINSVRQMQAELDQVASENPNTTAADARLAADADRYRRDVAERLAKFVQPSS